MIDAIELPFRRRAVCTLSNEICLFRDLDQIPIYVGQSIDGIHSRVNHRRPKLGARLSPIVTNWAEISFRKGALFREFHGRSALMNGKVPRPPKTNWAKAPEPFQRVQVVLDAEIAGEGTLRLVCRAKLNTTIRSSVSPCGQERETNRGSYQDVLSSL